MDSLPSEPQGKPKNTRVGSLSLLQWIFLTQDLNQGLLHCRQILYQLSYKGSPANSESCFSSDSPKHFCIYKFYFSLSYTTSLYSWIYTFPGTTPRSCFLPNLMDFFHPMHEQLIFSQSLRGFQYLLIFQKSVDWYNSQIQKMLKHYLSNASVPFSFSSPSDTPKTYRLYLSIMLHLSFMLLTSFKI